jgi:hypothetical protein
MISEYYLLIFLYPISYVLFLFGKRFGIKESHLLKGIFTAFFLVFYALFSTFIVSRAENSYLIITTLIFCLSLFSDELSLFNIFKYFTYFWLSLLLIWGFIDFKDTALILGVIPLLTVTKGTSNIVGKLVIWLAIVFLNFLVPTIGVSEGLILKNWLVELLFFLLLIFSVPFSGGLHFSNLMQFLLSLGVFHVALDSYGMMPNIFIKLVLAIQLIAVFAYIKTEKLVYLVLGVLLGSIVLIPYEGVSSLTQLSLVVYCSVFIFNKYELNNIRPLYTAVHLFTILFVFYLLFQVNQSSNWIITLASVQIMATIAINFMFRERLFLSRKLIKISHG